MNSGIPLAKGHSCFANCPNNGFYSLGPHFALVVSPVLFNRWGIVKGKFPGKFHLWAIDMTRKLPLSPNIYVKSRSRDVSSEPPVALGGREYEPIGTGQGSQWQATEVQCELAEAQKPVTPYLGQLGAFSPQAWLCTGLTVFPALVGKVTPGASLTTSIPPRAGEAGRLALLESLAN